MFRSLYVGGSLILFATAGFAQQSMQAQPVTGPVKDAGVLHLADGTWSRGPQAAIGAKTLYDNTAQTGFFGLFTATEIWTDEGRLPSCNDPAKDAKAKSYTVQSFQLAYCTSQPTGSGTQDVVVAFYESYASCTDPLTLTPAAAFQVTGLPGGPACGSTACWIVTLDLKGTTFEFDMAADGDGIWDNSTALDNFGWSFIQIDTSCGNAGPLLTGDPNNFPEGDGTYYQNPGATGTGQGTQDQFWLNDAGGPAANGCYWFGGYTTGNPWASFWLELGGDNADTSGCDSDTFGEKYCQANPSSCGAPCDISATNNGDGTYTLSASPAPLQPGIFFYADNQARIPFGNGFLCATGNIVRLLPPIFPDADCGTTTRTQGNLASGTNKNYQYWYRDPAGGGAFFNTSNALSITFP